MVTLKATGATYWTPGQPGPWNESLLRKKERKAVNRQLNKYYFIVFGSRIWDEFIWVVLGISVLSDVMVKPMVRVMDTWRPDGAAGSVFKQLMLSKLVFQVGRRLCSCTQPVHRVGTSSPQGNDILQKLQTQRSHSIIPTVVDWSHKSCMFLAGGDYTRLWVTPDQNRFSWEWQCSPEISSCGRWR